MLGTKARDGKSSTTNFEDLPILEELTRVYCRDKDKLKDVAKVIDDLSSNTEKLVIPKEFLDFWESFKTQGGEER